MAHAMVHRGPDSEGFLFEESIGLGMRRLRVIDLCKGDQPLYNEDRQIALIFNGEIYNFEELQQELQTLGHRFGSLGDGEVIIHAYEQWGKDCLLRLRGMFAFAIYDRRLVQKTGSRSILLARDRLGIKPLYISNDGKRLIFASEVRALLASGLVPRKLSAAGLFTYLAFGSVQEPLTVVEGVVSMAPGSWLQVDLGVEGMNVESGAYWKPPIEAPCDPRPGEVCEWLTDSVRSHLVSDVPLGAFLSGGMDSGAIVALGSRELDFPIRTFTLAFEEWLEDDRDRAVQTAHRWHTHHRVQVLSPSEMLAALPQAVSAMDQPTIDGINTWYVSREARRAGLTVALSGVGGDELFAGYASFDQVPKLKRVQRALAWLPRWGCIEDLATRLPGSNPGQRKVGALVSGGMFFNHAYFAVRGLFTPVQTQALLTRNATETLQAPGSTLAEWQRSVLAHLRFAQNYDCVGEVSWLEMTQYMRSTLLRDTDAMSMAHSLEVRVPFVDHMLVERVLPVKGQLKMNGRVPKALLAHAVHGLLPPAVTTGKKRTFTLPLERWLRHEWADVMDQALSQLPDQLSYCLDQTAVRRVWAQFRREQTSWSRPWSLFVLAQWTRNNL
jgi:asparagine synthase (glutamine-hydrolysing)